ncbi:hypothetical protein VSS74_22655 [Conexibacter stalactiti]|uniref:STAS domain-containing protein n=1 Tax=Conexibacter stalactiti TaxID=1940611 RepID=A0ABU4HVC5_9ACTN|nr:hypothetical protein [Conexibacter stalactiti]MDW5597165.1 hypothetical protein [Conexibacter stalactiti]MEC5037807.1 hypothetical protein [Conexibacter stalactiti]
MHGRDRDRPVLLRIALTGTYDGDDVERLIGDLDPLARLSRPVMLDLDVSGLVSLGAPAAAWLVAVVERARHADLLAHAAIIDSKRAGATLAAATGIGGRPPTAVHGYRFMERFSTQDELHAITEALSGTLAARGGLLPAEQLGLRMCLDELGENVTFHADSPTGGVISAWHPADTYEFEIGVADLGIGMRTSIARNPEHADVADDLDAMARVVTPRVTSTPHRNSGFGLPIASITFTANGGAFYLRSGAAVAKTGMNTSMRATSPHLPGTLTGASIRTDRPFDINVAYAELRQHFDASLQEKGFDVDDFETR